MGLFDFNKKKAEAAERKEAAMIELRSKLAQSSLLNDLIYSIINEREENPWIFESQGFDDSCQRIVLVGSNAVMIKWRTMRPHRFQLDDGSTFMGQKEDLHAAVGYSYVKSGYTDLENYTSPTIKDIKTGKPIVIDLEDVVYAWRDVFEERFKAEMQGFGNFTHDFEGTRAADPVPGFAYSLPKQDLKGWF